MVASFFLATGGETGCSLPQAAAADGPGRSAILHADQILREVQPELAVCLRTVLCTRIAFSLLFWLRELFGTVNPKTLKPKPCKPLSGKPSSGKPCSEVLPKTGKLASFTARALNRHGDEHV